MNRHGKGYDIHQAVAIARSDANNKIPVMELAKVLQWFEQGYNIVGMRYLGLSLHSFLPEYLNLI